MNPEEDKIEQFTETLTGHTSPETAFVVGDYPYGFRARTQIRYWIEYKKGFGMRFVSQTLNPKTGNWNKPKPGNYDLIKVMVRNPENGHISWMRLDWNDNEELTAAFEAKHAAALGKYELDAIRHIRAHNAACSKLTWTCGPVKEGDAPQTMAEQMAIIDALTRVELAKG